ncbi:MAG: hypothetical protein ACFFBP_23705, partial [Promethearchaeota archaeon]
IMAHYNETSHIFMDSYAERYLHTDFSSVNYYPTPTLLEVNCYAFLSLEILGELGLISVPGAVNFIRDCYNPDTSGFIGTPYSPNLNPNFKISTLDNTYCAILTLNKLGDDWAAYSNELSEVVYFIKSLQNTIVSSLFYGGFFNDEDDDFKSLDNLDITLLSSYYGLKSLDLLNRIVTYTEFKEFLDKHYESSVPYFEMSFVMQFTNSSNVIGSALGLQLSDISGYSAIDRDGVINFILKNRNSWGIWESSTTYPYHELIDTFQVIRALEEAGELSQLSANDKDQIATSIINYYRQYDNGFSLLSKDYTSLKHLQTVVKSAFNIYLKTEFTDYIQEIYDHILSSYYYDASRHDHFFAGAVNMFQTRPQGGLTSKDFRSRPIEFYNGLYDDYYSEIGLPYSHKTTYYALDILYYIGMLDEFENVCNLNNLIDNIIETQFLNASYSNYGGFLPNAALLGNHLDDSDKNYYVFLDYTFHAIKILELLVNFLKLGKVSDLNFNKAALYSYIISFINETSTTICCNVPYTKNSENMLMNTYYAIDLLMTLNLFDLQKQKIKNLILQTLDYTNIKSIYYSFKISKLLDLDIEFDIDLTSSLVEALYSTEFKEYYLSTDLQVLSQEAFLWVCDMAMNDEFEIECDYKTSVYLGAVNTITTSFSNMIFTKHDQYFTVNFESDQFGTMPLEKQFDSTYQLSFLVPEDSEYYPEISGILKIYHKNKLLSKLDIYFETHYDFYKSGKIDDVNDYISATYNISYGFALGKSPALDTTIGAIFYENDSIYNTVDFIREDFAEYSKFSLNYNNSEHHPYNVTLLDEFNPNGLILHSSISTIREPDPGPGPNPDPKPDSNSDSEPSEINWDIIILIIVLLGSLITGSLIVGVTKGKKWRRNRIRGINSDKNFRSNNQEKVPIKFFKNDSKFNQTVFKDEENYLDLVSKRSLNNLNNKNYTKLDSTEDRNSSSTILNKILMKNLEFTKSIIHFARDNKKLVFWTAVGISLIILTFVGTYYYAATLFLFFMIGGFIIIIIGILFIKNLKIIGVGILFVAYGFIIWFLKVNIMVLF